jgi:hypothetical protein
LQIVLLSPLIPLIQFIQWPSCQSKIGADVALA